MSTSISEIKDYWDKRASEDTTAQSTTNDVYLREIEKRVLGNVLSELSATTVLDIGCGDGRTTVGLAKLFPGMLFSGVDYSEAMISNACRNKELDDIQNVDFEVASIYEPLQRTFDIIYTTRCLINLPTWDDQVSALSNIYDALNSGGYYLMIENFIEGQSEFNRLRKMFSLSEIAVRKHNHFFEHDVLMAWLSGRFFVENEINISSMYYIVSRIVYSKLCYDNNVEPDYYDCHHKIASQLPFIGEAGPVRFLCLRKSERR